MESSQEFFVESEKGMEFRMVITKLESGGFQWSYSESKTSIDSVLYTQPINPTSSKPYRNANIAFEDMIQDVIKLLKEQGKDKIKDLNNPGDCELISLESQKKIVAGQSYVFPIKVKGKIVG